MSEAQGPKADPQEPEVMRLDADVYLDNPRAPVIFADGFAGLLTHEGCVRINLTFVQGAAPGTQDSIQNTVTGRLVLPIGAFARFAAALYDVYRNGVEKGYYPEVVPREAEAPAESGEQDKEGS